MTTFSSSGSGGQFVDDGTFINFVSGADTLFRIVKSTGQIETPASITNDVPM